MPHFHRNDNAGTVNTSMTAPDGSVIQVTFDNLDADLAALRLAGAGPGIVDQAVTTIGNSEQHRAIHAIRIGKNQAGRDVLVAGCHHAREWVSVEVPYLLAYHLVTNYNVARVTRIVDRLSIWVVPMVNPDGHERSIATNRLWRKNHQGGGAGVDLNRNYNAPGWGTVTYSCRPEANSQCYFGPNAASAAEVQNIQNLLLGHTVHGVNFTASLDFHSFCQYALYPWGYRHDAAHAASDAMAQTFVNAMQPADRYHCMQAALLYNHLFPTTVTLDDSRVPGGLCDFVPAQLGGRPAVTVELDPAFNDPRGFVVGEAAIQPNFAKVRDATLAFLDAVVDA
jgi:carboxypeptidase T